MSAEKIDFDEIKKKNQKKQGDWIKVGMSTCGIAAGADKVFSKFQEEKDRRHLEIRIEQCGCAGMCYAEPLVEILVAGMPRVTYGRVDEQVAVDIINQHILQNRLLDDHIYKIT